ncbi:MAG: hypothetical protein Kow0031_18900 [Anaerolineae bacterium]
MYNCRDCTLKTRCIEQSRNASSIKLMLHHAFENRTDTLATWKRLQRDCLITERRYDDLPKTTELKSLSRRLHQARKCKETPAKTLVTAAKASGVIGIEELDSRHNQRIQRASQVSANITRLKQKHVTTMLSQPLSAQGKSPSSFWLTIEDTWRHITLPTDGSLILGRFDPNIGIPPDVDLAFEDGQSHLVSRRHAALVGKNGEFTVEDLGSSAGVLLNNQKLDFGPSRPLRRGDRISLGDVCIIFDQIPAQVFTAFESDWVDHTLTVTATGHKYTLVAPNPVIIGRSDSHFNFVPEIDLNLYGQVTQRVSRRHATIIWQQGKPFVEDMGSGFGTKLHGTMLPLGEAVPLMPGDHIWLAGCVLAYDIEVKAVPVELGTVVQMPQLAIPSPVPA